jgi:hypothetical protein
MPTVNDQSRRSAHLNPDPPALAAMIAAMLPDLRFGPPRGCGTSSHRPTGGGRR